MFFSAGFFYYQKSCNAAEFGDVIVNEIAWMGTTVSANDEWLELKNITNHDIDLNGWSLVAQDGVPLINLSGTILANGYFLLERTDDTSVPNIKADKIYSGALDNNGEVLGLRDKDKNLIDLVEADKKWLAGDNISKKTMERTESNGWQTSQNIGGTPRAANNVVVAQLPSAPLSEKQLEASSSPISSTTVPTITSTTTSSITNVSNIISQSIYKLGNVSINEFVADPADNDVEWIEIYNATNKEIDLSGWIIENGSKTKTNLSGLLGIDGNARLKVVSSPAGILNNAGDLIIIRDNLGNLIDQVSYGDWDDGDKSNNASIAGDPFSVARKFDGYNTFNNANDFAVTKKPTKNVSNIIYIEDEVSQETKSKFDFSDDIFISEILPNPIGNDAKSEFIEIYNAGKRDVNLAGWSLSNEDNKKNNFEKIATSTIIKAGEYLTFSRQQTKIVMYNDSGEVKLFQPLADKPIQTVKYKNVKEGNGYNLILPIINKQEEYDWSETITRGSVNIIKIINHQPKVAFDVQDKIIAGQQIVFDSSDTFDQDGDNLKFSWNFGDGTKLTLPSPEHTFLRPGVYTVSLIVSDGQSDVKKEKNIKVLDLYFLNSQNSLIPFLKIGKGDVVINEIFPNPAGIDKNNEWLELKNQSSYKINLLDWQIENNNGKYKFKNDLWLESENFYLLTNKKSEWAFKNNSDIISLYDNTDKLIDKVEYTEAVQNEAYSRGENDKWFWTSVPTPGIKNIINISKSYDKINNQVAGIKISKEGVIETTLEKIKEYEVGDLIKVKGKVAVEPEILGAQIFYIVGSPGIQIYNYKKEFPNLKIGDYIEVAGELSEINGERRLKTKELADIKILEHQNAPVAQVLSCDKVNEEYIGQLISITGEVTDRKSSTVYLDDGNDEIVVYIKRATGIKPSSLVDGKTYAITGVVVKTQSGLRLMPRSSNDIVVQNQTSENSDVLGEVVVGNERQVASRDKKLELFKYLLIIAGGTIILLIGLMIKIWKNKIK